MAPFKFLNWTVSHHCSFSGHLEGYIHTHNFAGGYIQPPSARLCFNYSVLTRRKTLLSTSPKSKKLYKMLTSHPAAKQLI